MPRPAVRFLSIFSATLASTLVLNACGNAPDRADLLMSQLPNSTAAAKLGNQGPITLG